MHSSPAGFFRCPNPSFWVLAQFRHPFQTNAYVQMWWQETRHESEKGTGVPPPAREVPRAVPQMQPLQACTSRQPPQCFWPKQHPQLRALGAAARDGVLHPTKVTNCRALAPAASDCPHRGCLQVHSFLRPRRSCVDDPTCHPTTSCSASGHATIVTHLFSDQERALEFLQQRSPGPALGSYRLISFRSFPGTLVLHVAQINAPWRTMSTGLGTLTVLKQEAVFDTDRSLAENFHVISQHRSAVLFKDTFARDFTCAPIHFPCSLT